MAQDSSRYLTSPGCFLVCPLPHCVLHCVSFRLCPPPPMESYLKMSPTLHGGGGGSCFKHICTSTYLPVRKHTNKEACMYECEHILLPGTVARDFLASVFSWIFSIWASDIESKRVFFSFSFFAKLFEYFDESAL